MVLSPGRAAPSWETLGNVNEKEDVISGRTRGTSCPISQLSVTSFRLKKDEQLLRAASSGDRVVGSTNRGREESIPGALRPDGASESRRGRLNAYARHHDWSSD